MRHLIISIGSLSLAAFCWHNQAFARNQTNSEEIKSPLAGLYDCAAIKSSEDRLACFDQMVASLQVKEEKKEIVAIDAEVAKTIKKEAFGFNLPSLPKLALPKLGADKEIDEVSLEVKAVQPYSDKYIIRMKNGQVWRVVSGRVRKIPKGDLTATIKPAALGSYRLNLTNGRTTIRGLAVRRLK